MVDLNGIAIHDKVNSVFDYRGRDFKGFDLKDWFQFAKANKEFKEPGVSYKEMKALHEGLEILGHKPLNILETGMCFGTTTRYFILRKLKYGGEINTVEVHIKEQFKQAMIDLDLWKEINVIEGNSMRIPWDKKLDVLFIDSEHSLSDALGEYMRYRLYIEKMGLVAFHDVNSCYGVTRAIQIITGELDELELVSQCVDKSEAGLKVFQIKALGKVQNKINREMVTRKEEWQKNE